MKLLSEFHWKSSPKYRAVLTCDPVIDLQMGYRGDHEFVHEGTTWGFLHDDILTMQAGYASDLCSPGFYLFGKWHGTYSKGCEIPAYLHDFARQFMRPNVACSPWDRKGADDLFYNAMTMVKFPGRGLYHGAVKGPIGNLWMHLNRSRPKTSCRCHP